MQVSDNASQSASNQQLEMEPNEITYSVIDIESNEKQINQETISKLASSINVRLSVDGNQNFPFIEFENFDSLEYEEKIFLYGTSGSGKSRALFELIKKGMDNSRKIYIINPRNNVGDESGRIPLRELMSKINSEDTVVWDNFPDDLIRRDAENSKRVLELLSSKNVQKLIVVLKPKYLEIFKNIPYQIPEFFPQEIKYSKTQFKKIIQQYGTAIPQFKNIFEKYISSNLEKISGILWNKEPIPLKVFDFFNELKNKEEDSEVSGNLDVIKEAEQLMRSTNYYQHQFGLLNGMEERKREAEFLCILKMCYELGIDRTETNISDLQLAIFGTESPKESYNKLSNWLYISGYHYCMHDVCRDAVRISDYIKMKMLSYISDNFEAVIKENSVQSVNLLGQFIGKNIQFVPIQTSSNRFLPDNIYNKMKTNADLEKSIGIGAGESFQSLDDELRNTLRKKCDTDLIFGIGMAEGLAQSFILLDSEQRKLVLQKIYSGFFFARFFGKTLGLLLKDLDLDIRNEILPHVETNSQFADGIAMGIGPMLDSIDADLRIDIINRAKQNIALTRGLGFSLTHNISSLDENQRKLVYSKTDNDFQYDVGLSFGLAEQYTNLPQEIQKEALRRCEDHNGFAKGFGLYLILVTLDNCPQEVLDKVDKNGELAYSLGFGSGWVFPYLGPKFQSWATSKSEENNRFERGFGFGFGLILRHLPEEERNRQFSLGSIRSEFDYGLGSGISFTWDCQSLEDKKAAYARCDNNNSFAQGIGYGHGYSFHYLSEDEKSEIFQIAQNNGQFANGLGYGLGWSFPYSDDALRTKMFEKSKTNNYFALGLGSGLGQIYKYLSEEIQKGLFLRSNENGWFAIGLGIGMGRYAMSYLGKEVQEFIFSESNINTEFALGLGEGLGREFNFFDQEFQERILNKISKNPFYAKGLGIGFGLNYQNVSSKFQSDLHKRSEDNVHFSEGLGEGLGIIFNYLNDAQKESILNMALINKNDGLVRGIGVGLGSTYTSLKEDFRKDLLSKKISENEQFALGIGKGLGSIFTYLGDNIHNHLLEISQDNKSFSIGLGEGLGTILFSSLNSEERKNLLDKTKENTSLSKGLGIGIGLFFIYYAEKKDIHDSIFSIISSNSSIEEGFGIGIGMRYHFMSERLRIEILNLSKRSTTFARSMGFGFGHFPSELKSKQLEESIENNTPQNNNFKFGYGAGIGHHFPYLDVKTQGEILNKAIKENEFGKGFGFGLSKSFNLLDSILEKEILKHAFSNNNDFTFNLGYSLGNLFPSIKEELQKTLLQSITEDNYFARGFTIGIMHSLKYLNETSQRQISEIIKQNKNKKNSEHKASQVTSNENQKDDFIYEYFIGKNSISSFSNKDTLQSSILDKEEIDFSGERKKCCVCFIDMMNSTKIASQLNKSKLSKYYSMFLNSMATIIKNFNGKIVKNAGDCLIYYFPEAADLEFNPSKLKDVLECGMTMIAAYDVINSRMKEENLPPLNYRISADYGSIDIARSKSSQSEDLFGSTVNVCAKINGKSLPNGMIVGGDLYRVASELLNEYSFSQAGEVNLGLANRGEYTMYQVSNKPGNEILQPFKHRPS